MLTVSLIITVPRCAHHLGECRNVCFMLLNNKRVYNHRTLWEVPNDFFSGFPCKITLGN